MRKLIVIITIFQFSCSPPVDKTKDQNVQALPDSLFPLKNISKTEIPDDSKLKYHDLDSLEKMAYVAPIFLKDKSHSIDQKRIKMKILEWIVEALSWLKIAASPTLLGLFFGFLFYLFKPDVVGLIFGGLISVVTF